MTLSAVIMKRGPAWTLPRCRHHRMGLVPPIARGRDAREILRRIPGGRPGGGVGPRHALRALPGLPGRGEFSATLAALEDSRRVRRVARPLRHLLARRAATTGGECGVNGAGNLRRLY